MEIPRKCIGEYESYIDLYSISKYVTIIIYAGFFIFDFYLNSESELELELLLG